jgi:predicted transcriptional regulator
MDKIISYRVNQEKARIIKETVARESGISIEKLESKKRYREIVEIRQMAMVLMQQHTSLSLKAIGDYFGKRDHSTVLHARRSVEALMETDKSFKKRFSYLTAEILRCLAEHKYLNSKQVKSVIDSLHEQINKLTIIYNELQIIENYDNYYKNQQPTDFDTP